MKNHINKNINTNIKWSKEENKIRGLYILDKTQKTETEPNGYCGSIDLTTGNNLEIWTNGKYQHIKKEIAIKLLKELLERLK